MPSPVPGKDQNGKNEISGLVQIAKDRTPEIRSRSDGSWQEEGG